MDEKTILILSIYLVFNFGVFVYMGLDKVRALKKVRRIPEAHFLFLSICFCALGVLLGMLIFRHKIRKMYFLLGVPLALVENVSLVYFLYLYFR